MGIINLPVKCLPSHPNSPQIKKYLRFALSTVLYQFQYPITLPHVCKEVRPLGLIKGNQIHKYLDDSLIIAQTEWRLATKQTESDFFSKAGTIINQKNWT